MSRQEFTVEEGSNKKVKLAIRQAQYQDYEEADHIYATKIAALVKESSPRKKLLLRSDVDKFLKANGVWTQEDEDNVAKFRTEIEANLAKLNKGGMKRSEGKQLAMEITDKRREIIRIMTKRQIFDDVTIESMAENEKVDYLIYICTVYADSGDNYWDSFEDMKNDKLSEAYRKASIIVAETVYNIDPNFERNLPENKWLHKYGYIDDELNYVDPKTGERVNRDGKPVKQLEEELKELIEKSNSDIKEEAPFIDDDTGEPIVFENKAEIKEDQTVSAT